MRVEIKPVCLRDADELIKANCANQAFHAPWSGPFRDASGFDAWYGRILTGPNLGFVARKKGTSALVGVINVSEIVWGAFRSAYLGYYGFEALSGKGLMTEAVGLVCDEMFSGIGLHRLEANIQPGNTRSLQLVSRLNFNREGLSRQYLKIAGEWRDHERWARLTER